MKYRKKPVEIEAVQFIDTPERIKEIAEFMGGELHVNYEDKDNPYIQIETPEGTMKASVGDYIIKGVKGEYYPCKPDVFEATYYCVDSPLDRMEVEVNELACKLNKLDTFMNSDKYISLPNDIIGLLNIQYGAMMAYGHALQVRIFKMRENKE